MKKTDLIIATIITIVIVYAPAFTFVWTVISFILYLFKDIPFCWWSLIAYLVFKFIKTFFFLLEGKAPCTYKSKLAERIEELRQKKQADI